MLEPSPRTRSRRHRVAAALAGTLAGLLLLSACSGPSAPSVVTVQGRVLDVDKGPVAKATVLIDGKVTTTASDGSFTVTNVATPYDAAVTSSSWYDVYVFEGLGRSDPTLQVNQLSTGSYATVAGSLGSAPFQSSEVGAVVPVGSSDADGEIVAAAGSGPAFGPGYLYWPPTGPLATTLYGLRALTDSSGFPTSFTGMGSLPITLHNGDALTNVTIPMGPVGTAALSGSFQLPSGYALTNFAAVVRFGTSTSGALLALPVPNLTPGGAFSNAMVPQASGLGYGLVATANDGNGSSTAGWGIVAGPGTAASYAPPAAPQVTAPADGTTHVTTATTFSWAALPGSVYVLNVTANTGSGPYIRIVTTRTSATIPDLSAINRGLPNNATVSVNLWATGPYASMDDATSASGMWSTDAVLLAFFDSSPMAISGNHAPGWSTSSKTITVTTAP